MQPVSRSRAHLAFGDKNSDGMVLAAGRQGITCRALHPELIPHGDKVVRLVKLDLVRHQPSAVLLVCRVLEVPIALLLLDEATQRLLLGVWNAFLDYSPDFEVLGGITGLVLPGALPGNDEGATGREVELIDVDNG